MLAQPLPLRYRWIGRNQSGKAGTRTDAVRTKLRHSDLSARISNPCTGLTVRKSCCCRELSRLKSKAIAHFTSGTTFALQFLQLTEVLEWKAIAHSLRRQMHQVFPLVANTNTSTPIASPLTDRQHTKRFELWLGPILLYSAGTVALSAVAIVYPVLSSHSSVVNT